MMNLERARDLKNNLLWGEITEELDRKIYLIGQKLHTCTADQLQMFQAEIRILNGVKRLPDEVIERESEVEGKMPSPS